MIKKKKIERRQRKITQPLEKKTRKEMERINKKRLNKVSKKMREGNKDNHKTKNERKVK